MNLHFGQLFQAAMHDADLSATEVAGLVGVAESTISRIKSGKSTVTYEIAVKLADCLRIHDEDRTAFIEAAARTHIPDTFPPIAAAG